jgi:hypothetical protein
VRLKYWKETLVIKLPPDVKLESDFVSIRASLEAIDPNVTTSVVFDLSEMADQSLARVGPLVSLMLDYPDLGFVFRGLTSHCHTKLIEIGFGNFCRLDGPHDTLELHAKHSQGSFVKKRDSSSKVASFVRLGAA